MCYSLIIVDDEQIERDVLKLIIEREVPEVKIVAEAKNGRQALELANQWNPDLMMVDIKMPGMDGLSVVRELSGILSQTKFVLVSAYDYFDYAQEAITLGVKEYLLKPTSKQQVIDTLRRLVSEIEQERARRQEEEQLREKLAQLLPIVEKELSTLLMLNEEIDSFQTYSDLLQLEDVEGFAIVASFHPQADIIADSLELSVYKQKWSEMLRTKAKEWSHALISPFLWRQIAIFVLSDASAKEEYSSRVRAIQLARRLCNLFHHEPVRVKFGIGNVYKGFDGLRQSYQEAVLAVKDPTVPASVHHFGDLPFAAKTFAYSLEKEKQLIEKVRLGKTDESLAIFYQMLDEVARASQADIRYLRRFLLESVTVVSRIAFEYQFHLDEFSKFSVDELDSTYEIKQAGEYWIRKITKLIHEERQRKTGSVLEQVKEYLQEHFAEDVTLEDVAEMHGISPYYLSKLFSQQNNITFIDYLTDLRMEEAKNLLVDTQKGLKEIAIDVGYANSNYFCRVFKKKTGLTPSEFRREVLDTGQNSVEDSKKG